MWGEWLAWVSLAGAVGALIWAYPQRVDRTPTRGQALEALGRAVDRVREWDRE